MTNYEYVQKGFTILHGYMAGYIGRELNRIYGSKWWDKVLFALDDQVNDLPVSGDYAELIDSLDIANCLRLIDRQWADVFKLKLSIDCRTWAKELMGVRNKTSHKGQQDFDQAYAERALDTMALLCESFEKEGEEEIRKLYRELRYGSEQGSSAVESVETKESKKEKAAVVEKISGSSLLSWRDVIQPHPDVAEGRYKAAEFAADLAQVSRGEGAIEYRDPVEFFSRTYVTEGMSGLLVQSIQRLAGNGGEPVIQLKTAFGGGKTHSMLALYHIVRGSVSVEYNSNLETVLKKAGLSDFPKANVAVLVGTALDPTRKKNPANFPGYTVSTIWGEMAYQLVTSAGKPDLYAKYIRESDRKGVSPGSENLKNLFNDCGPCLILMDELVAYAKKIYGVEGLPAGSYDNFITFIQEITEAARASENSLVVASIPESDIEIGGDAGKTCLEAIEHTFGRMESIWKPVSANEGFEVVRRRLFLDCKDQESKEKTCDAFSKMYQENTSEFPSESKEVDYKRRLESCYPIHPEIFDRLYGDWATLERFQRTRGVLRLMSAVIHELWMANDASAMIMPGSITLDMPPVREELTRHLPDNWNSIVDKEVDGKASIPYAKDKEISRYGKSLACRRVARTIMLGSAPSMAALSDQGIRGLEISRILLGTVQPGENVSDFKDALNTLHGSLKYLYNNPNGNRYWYDTKPTLRKTAEDRSSQIQIADVDIEIENRLKRMRKESPFAGIHICPSSSNDIPDEQAVRLVILRTKDTYKRNSDKSNACNVVIDILNNRGSAPRVYRNMLAFVAPDADKIGALQQEVKRFIAWTSIMTDKDELSLDGAQVRETQNNINRSNEIVESRLKETYCWLLVPSIDRYEDMKTIQWEVSDLGGGTDSIVTKASKKMIQSEQVITKWAPSLLCMELNELLWKEQNDIQIKKLWEYLSVYCYLPRLSGYSVLEETIEQGVVSKEYFGVAGAYESERYVDLKIGQSVFGLNQSDLLVKPDVALKQIEKESENKENDEDSGSPSVSDNGKKNNEPQPSQTNKHFKMTAKLDELRYIKDVTTYYNEIIQHLIEIDGSKVELRLEVEVETQDGIPDTTIRTVSENCKALKVIDFEFDD